ncbi:hypothetical protein [Spiroplasma floricola]|uniref:Lipoprotein n=1 Tax=Spiroplasma floricola 23-6 TaxID=1336749 RepID=A0A2K8SDN9_9MOLU|nr:hypothetical protein [Spiroplasma floricola]AUB31574.1 hypothetical protein SFLOR_v1c05220 [Spiroplasma floricola 23-6]
MKKILTLLSGLTIFSAPITTVISCRTTPVDPPPTTEEDDYAKLIQELTQDVRDIYNNHYAQVISNLIGVPSTEISNEFLREENIKANSGKESEITDKQRLAITNDFNKIMRTNELFAEFRKMTEKDKYKILFYDIETISEITINFDTLKINNGHIEENNIWMGNVQFDFKVIINYNNGITNNTEALTLNETFAYSSTESDAFKQGTDNFLENITRDYYTSNDAIEYTDLFYNKIAPNGEPQDAYSGYYENYIKDFYNKDEEFKNNLTNFISNKYFSSIQSLPLIFSQDGIYQEINKVNNMEKKLNPIEYTYDVNNTQNDAWFLFNSIFKLDPNSLEASNIINDKYLLKNKNDFESDYLIKQEEFLKEKDIELTSEISDRKGYKNAISMDIVSLNGLSIKVGGGSSSVYEHRLPKFDLLINYSANDQTGKLDVDDLNTFIKHEIKSFRNIFGIESSQMGDPKKLMTITNTNEFFDSWIGEFVQNSAVPKKGINVLLNLTGSLNTITNNITNFGIGMRSKLLLESKSDQYRFAFVNGEGPKFLEETTESYTGFATRKNSNTPISDAKNIYYYYADWDIKGKNLRLL